MFSYFKREIFLVKIFFILEEMSFLCMTNSFWVLFFSLYMEQRNILDANETVILF